MFECVLCVCGGKGEEAYPYLLCFTIREQTATNEEVLRTVEDAYSAASKLGARSKARLPANTSMPLHTTPGPPLAGPSPASFTTAVHRQPLRDMEIRHLDIGLQRLRLENDVLETQRSKVRCGRDLDRVVSSFHQVGALFHSRCSLLQVAATPKGQDIMLRQLIKEDQVSHVKRERKQLLKQHRARLAHIYKHG